VLLHSDANLGGGNHREAGQGGGVQDGNTGADSNMESVPTPSPTSTQRHMHPEAYLAKTPTPAAEAPALRPAGLGTCAHGDMTVHVETAL
jgi:hypothetical protein